MYEFGGWHTLCGIQVKLGQLQASITTHILKKSEGDERVEAHTVLIDLQTHPTRTLSPVEISWQPDIGRQVVGSTVKC